MSVAGGLKRSAAGNAVLTENYTKGKPSVESLLYSLLQLSTLGRRICWGSSRSRIVVLTQYSSSWLNAVIPISLMDVSISSLSTAPR